jgi:hypothetical protein
MSEKLRDARELAKLAKRAQKAQMKAQETPEEKRARRLAKKTAKEESRKKGLGWGDECMGYSNVDNPFGDANLTETFVWEKKLQKQGITKIDTNDLREM